MNIEERFWSKVNKDGPIPEWNPDLGPCWIWTAGRFQTGYGKFFQTKGANLTRLAHRISYTWDRGESIPEGLVIDHLCHVRECVRPSHMEATTDKVNISRGLAPSAIRAKSDVCIRGHKMEGYNILWKRNGTRRDCRECNNLKQNERYAKRRTETP